MDMDGDMYEILNDKVKYECPVNVCEKKKGKKWMCGKMEKGFLFLLSKLLSNSWIKSLCQPNLKSFENQLESRILLNGGIMVSKAAFLIVDPGSIPGHRRHFS